MINKTERKMNDENQKYIQWINWTIKILYDLMDKMSDK